MQHKNVKLSRNKSRRKNGLLGFQTLLCHSAQPERQTVIPTDRQHSALKEIPWYSFLLEAE
jgi:hypothetical protein